MEIFSLAVGILGFLAALYFGLKQISAKKIMRTFIQTIAAQSQSVANSLVELKQADYTKVDLIKGKIEETSRNMEALNGSIQYYYEKHHKKK